MSCWVQSHIVLQTLETQFRLSCVSQTLRGGTYQPDIYKIYHKRCKKLSIMWVIVLFCIWWLHQWLQLMTHWWSNITRSHLQKNISWPWETWEMNCATEDEHLSFKTCVSPRKQTPWWWWFSLWGYIKRDREREREAIQYRFHNCKCAWVIKDHWREKETLLSNLMVTS